MSRFSYRYAEELEEFYKGASHSDELQNKLDLMKRWTEKRLAAAVPAWAKCKMLPPYRGPQLSQIFPSWTTGRGMPKSAPHPAEDFTYRLGQLTDVRDYVAAWDAAHGYVPGATVWAQAQEQERIAA